MIIKKIKYLLLITFCFTVFQAVSVFAAPSQVACFSIAEGFDISKSYEATFDSSRVISGTADKGSVVNISVYDPDVVVNGSYSKLSSYTLTVGQSGIFRKTVDLKLGKNYVVVTATYNGQSQSYSTIINRKESSIQSDLDGIIVLPGQSYAFNYTGMLS
ncbi:MAG: hypothetical protein LUC92_07675 [Clostridiales bacterium]|nr:hypothetical protein [Clostridiales bacterium]